MQYLRKLLGEKKYDEQEKIKADEEEIDLTSLTGEVSKSGTRVDRHKFSLLLSCVISVFLCSGLYK